MNEFAADPLAMAVLMELRCGRVAERYVQVERTGELSRGMTVIDWWGDVQKPATVESF